MRRGPRLALLVIGWGVLTGHVFSGCRDLFTPAVPEPPTGQSIVLNYRSPEATLNTMEAGIVAKGRGSQAWLGGFADSTQPSETPAYHQFFDSGDVGLFEAACGCEAPPDWRASQEQNFFQAFIEVRPSDDYVLVLEPRAEQPDPQPGATQIVLYRQYQVLATAPDGNSTLIIATGLADLTFTLRGSDWLITRWDDHVNPDVGVNPSDPYQVSLGRRRLESTR